MEDQSKTSKKVLVTGASGFVGRHLLPRLKKDGWDIYIFHKAGEPKQYCRELGIVNICEGDLRDNCEELRELFQAQKFDAVIHLAALIKASWDDFMRVNVLGTRYLMRLVEEQPTIKHFIFISTDFVLYDSANDYKESKRLSEVDLRASAVPYIIFRPTPIYGSGDTKNFADFFALIKRLPIIPTANFVMQPVYVGDVVGAIIKALATDVSIRKEYNIPGGSIMTFPEMVRVMCDAMGSKRLILPLPRWMFIAAVKIQEKILRNPILNYYQAEKWAKNKPADAYLAQKEIGFTQTSFKDGAVKTLRNTYIE